MATWPEASGFVVTGISSRQQTGCVICGTPAIQAINLPKYPVTELYEDFEEAFEAKGFFDQSLLYCEDCDHSFLGTILDPGFIYSNYLTTSTGSAGAEVCLKNLHTFMTDHLDVSDYGVVIDVGGNDSFFLNLIVDDRIRKINIDPNGTGPEPVRVERTNIEELDLEEFRDGRKIIVSSHTIEHVEDPNQMVAALAAVMSEDDVCLLQFPSLEMLTSDFRFDQICHQHLNYFSSRSISKLLHKHGLAVRSMEFDSNHFGTLRVLAGTVQAGTPKAESEMVPSVSLAALRQNWKTYRDYLSALDQSVDARADHCSGFGAGLMVPTLAYSLPALGKLRCLYDDNPDKHGKRFINLNVEIRPSSEMTETETIVLTSISTKLSARRILMRLLKDNVREVIVPNLSF